MLSPVCNDMHLYHWLPSDPRMAVEVLGFGLEQVRDWMKVNKLKLNPGKTEVLVVGPHLALWNCCTLMLDGGCIPLDRSGLQLGGLLDPTFLLGKQIAAMTRMAFY